MTGPHALGFSEYQCMTTISVHCTCVSYWNVAVAHFCFFPLLEVPVGSHRLLVRRIKMTRIEYWM